MADNKRDEAADAILDRIMNDISTTNNAGAIREFAEAWAWLKSPRRTSSS